MSNKNTEILLVRHAFNVANNAGWNNQIGIREQFIYDELFPLDKQYGVKQAEELGNFFNKYLSGKKSLFVVSPYYRTLQTFLHSIQKLNKDSYDMVINKSIREINQGLSYSQPKDYMDSDIDMKINKELRQGSNSIAIPYLQGESELDVRRRLRHFVSELKKIQASGIYDEVIIISHETVLKNIYQLYFNKDIGIKQPTASVIKMDENPSQIFVPNISVPKGYNVSFEQYDNYFMLMSFYNLIQDNKNNRNFQSFYGDIKLLLEDSCFFIPRKGETLVIPPDNTSQKGLFYIDCNLGQDAYTYDKQSTSTYFILDGSGCFDINGKLLNVSKGDIVTIPPNTIFYYSGKMKLIEKMEPNFKEENIVVVKDVNYEEELEDNISNGQIHYKK